MLTINFIEIFLDLVCDEAFLTVVFESLVDRLKDRVRKYGGSTFLAVSVT
jgi:hypothetical protein